MTEFIESVENNPKTQKDKELIVNKYSNESYKTQSQIGQTVFVQRRIYQEAVEFLCKTIEDMDEEIDFF